MMKIAILGSGNVGKALAGNAVRAGHEAPATRVRCWTLAGPSGAA